MSMEAVVFLVLVLAGGTRASSLAAGSQCNATLNASECSVTQGASVYIQVMNNASGYRLRCKKEVPTRSIIVFSVKKGNVTILGEIKTRAEFFIHNGTFKIREVEKNDSGRYNVEVFDQDGLQLRINHIRLDVTGSLNMSYIIIGCSAAGILLAAMICCCCICKVRHNKKSGSGKL